MGRFIQRSFRQVLVLRLRLFARKWDQFWFRAEALPQLVLFRVLLGALLFLFFSTRLLDLELFYSDRGVLPLEQVSEFGDIKYLFALQLWGLIPAAHWVFGIISVLASLTLLFGVFPRVSAALLFVAHLGFSQRNPMLVYGFDKVVAFFLISLIISGPHLSLMQSRGFWFSRLSSLALRLGQIQVAVIYVFSGLEKLKGPMWWRGESVWAVLANSQMAQFDFAWTAHFPVALTLATYATLIWEIYFIALVWRRPWTYPVLLFGVMLHLGIGVAMGLPYFAAGMVFSYVFFVRAEHALTVIVQWQRSVTRIRRTIFFGKHQKKLQVSTQSSDPISV